MREMEIEEIRKMFEKSYVEMLDLTLRLREGKRRYAVKQTRAYFNTYKQAFIDLNMMKG